MVDNKSGWNRGLGRHSKSQLVRILITNNGILSRGESWKLFTERGRMIESHE